MSCDSFIRQCFNILIRHCNPSRIRNINRTIKTTVSKQYTSFISPLPKVIESSGSSGGGGGSSSSGSSSLIVVQGVGVGVVYSSSIGYRQRFHAVMEFL